MITRKANIYSYIGTIFVRKKLGTDCQHLLFSFYVMRPFIISFVPPPFKKHYIVSF